MHITNKRDYLQFFTKCDLNKRDLAYFGIKDDTEKIYHKKYT